MRWAVAAGVTVYAVPREIHTEDCNWIAPGWGQAEFQDYWLGFDYYTREDEAVESRHWDEFARRTKHEFWFRDDTEDPVSGAIKWPINTGWFYVPLTDNNPEFIGFLVDSDDCVELPF